MPSLAPRQARWQQRRCAHTRRQAASSARFCWRGAKLPQRRCATASSPTKSDVQPGRWRLSPAAIGPWHFLVQRRARKSRTRFRGLWLSATRRRNAALFRCSASQLEVGTGPCAHFVEFYAFTTRPCPGCGRGCGRRQTCRDTRDGCKDRDRMAGEGTMLMAIEMSMAGSMGKRDLRRASSWEKLEAGMRQA